MVASHVIGMKTGMQSERIITVVGRPVLLLSTRAVTTLPKKSSVKGLSVKSWFLGK